MKNVNRFFTLAATLSLSVAAFAQNTYVSTPIVKAMESGKYYMAFDMVQDGYRISVETAFRGGVSMSRVDMNGMNAVSMMAGGQSYLLDESNKTWSVVPMETAPSIPSHLKFVRQGSCLVNGEKGWYFDEYSADGTPVRFYYNSGNVSVIEMDGSGPMVLRSFSSTIPSRMYFCLGKGWRGSGGGVPPPQCSSSWTDTGTALELAGQTNASTVAVSGIQAVSAPVYASDFGTAVKRGKARMDRNVTEEGVWLALQQIVKESEGKTDAELEEEFLEYTGEVSRLYFSGVVTGEMIEGLIARASVCPHPAILTTTGDLLTEIGQLELGKKYYEYAITVDGTLIRPRYALLEYYLDLDNYTKARGIVNWILEMGPHGLEDGRAYLYKAMLQLKEGKDMDAVTTLFKSMSLGYFDENSLIMLTSILNQLEMGFFMAYDDKLDPMPMVREVFSDSNLTLLKKAITYSKENEIVPESWDLSFGPPAPGGLEALRKYNRGKEESLDKRASEYDAYAGRKAEKDPNVALCLSKGIGYLMQGFDAGINYLADETSGSTSRQEAASAAAAATATSAYIAEFTSGSYDRLTSIMGMELGVSSFYLPDMRTFWCLYALNRYYMYLMRYASGNVSEKQCPPAYKEWMSLDNVTSKKFSDRQSVLLEKELVQEMELAGKCQKLFDDWSTAHPDASDSTIARAHRRFFRPYRIMSEVDHPLERLNVIEIPQDEEMMRHRVDYYRSGIMPLLSDWWADIDRYSQYCLSSSVRDWVRYSTASSVLQEQSLIYGAAAGRGEFFADTRTRLEKKRAAILEQEYRDRAESLKEFEEDYQALLLQEELIPPPLMGKYGDLNAKVSLPFGDIRIGYISGKWGVQLENNISVKDYLMLALEDTAAGDFLHSLGVEEITPSRELKIMDDARKKLYDKAQGIAEKLIGSGPGAAAIAALKAKNGDLIQTKSEQLKDEVIRDKNGNLWVKKTREDSVNINNQVKMSRSDISAGRARVRRDACTFNLFGVEIDAAQYHRTRR